MPKSALSGTRIRTLRTARRMGQADLARLAGVSPSYLNLIEHNRRRASPRILEAIAGALNIPAEALDERAGDALIDALRAAATRAAPGTAPETDRAEDFAGRYPGWSALVTQLHASAEAQERIIERLSDRMAHDPNLSAALHEIVSAVTAVQSTAAILAESDDLEPVWRARFHANIHADSVRLANAAEALVAFLDTSTEETGLAAPQEELESWLEAQGYHVAAVEGAPVSDWGRLTAGQAELASAAARSLAADWLVRAQQDAAALPLDRLMPALTAMMAARRGFAPEALAQEFGVGLAQLFRRLACLPPAPGLPRFGLAVCDGSGTLTFRRPIEGFQLPRFGGACPLWPLYQALLQPGRPVRATVEFAGRPPARFVAHAVSGPRGAQAFEAPYVWEASMLVTPASVALGAEGDAALAVGSNCRVCPRLGCPARREPSIVAG